MHRELMEGAKDGARTQPPPSVCWSHHTSYSCPPMVRDVVPFSAPESSVCAARHDRTAVCCPATEQSWLASVLVARPASASPSPRLRHLTNLSAVRLPRDQQGGSRGGVCIAQAHALSETAVLLVMLHH